MVIRDSGFLMSSLYGSLDSQACTLEFSLGLRLRVFSRQGRPSNSDTSSSASP